MIDCVQIPNLLVQQQRALDKVNAQLDDPEQACLDAGIQAGSDECILYIKSLEKQAAMLKTSVTTLQSQQSVCGTWRIEVQFPTQIFSGQFTIATWDSDITDTWHGTMSLPDPSPQPTAVNGTLFEGKIHFTRTLLDNSTEEYSGTANVSTQPPTMQGNGVQNPPPSKSSSMTPFTWSAQKQS